MTTGARHKATGNSRRTSVFSFALSSLLFALYALADAQQDTTSSRIGYLSGRTKPTSSAPDTNLNAFRRGLRELGYVEGRDIVIEYRFADGKNDRLPALATELVRMQ